MAYNTGYTNAEIQAQLDSADDIAKINSAGLLKTDGSGGISKATSGTDYQAPLTAGSNITISGTTISADASKPQLDSIDISNTWTGSSSPYSQIVTLNDSSTLTSNSKVDLQPSSTVLAQMATDSCTALYIENNSGTLTLYAIGAGLTVAQSDVQVTITEVA